MKLYYLLLLIFTLSIYEARNIKKKNNLNKLNKLNKLKRFKTKEDYTFVRQIDEVNDGNLNVNELWYVIDEPCQSSGHAKLFIKASNGCYYFFDVNGIKGEVGVRTRVFGRNEPTLHGEFKDKKLSLFSHFILDVPLPVHHMAHYANSIWKKGGQIFKLDSEQNEKEGMNCYLFADRLYNIIANFQHAKIPEVNALKEYSKFCKNKIN